MWDVPIILSHTYPCTEKETDALRSKLRRRKCWLKTLILPRKCSFYPGNARLVLSHPEKCEDGDFVEISRVNQNLNKSEKYYVEIRRWWYFEWSLADGRGRNRFPLSCLLKVRTPRQQSRHSGSSSSSSSLSSPSSSSSWWDEVVGWWWWDYRIRDHPGAHFPALLTPISD